MKIIEQSHEIFGEFPVDVKESILCIERFGRVCWRSEDKIIEGSGIGFINGVSKLGHNAVFEMSNLVLRSKNKCRIPCRELDRVSLSLNSKFLDFTTENDYVYIGGNYRAWMEALGVGIDTILSIVEFKTCNFVFGYEVISNHEEIPWSLKRVGVSFVTDRAVTHEFVRHRPCSFLQESQRYCAYKKHIEFIRQWWWPNDEYGYSVLGPIEELYKETLESCNPEQGRKAEQARAFLPNCTATRIVVGANLPEWYWIFNLRTPKNVYPGMKNLMVPVQGKFNSRWPK